MHHYLLFRIYGTIVSWGDLAVGEIRSTAQHPSKSSIVGLISASLGYRREEFEKINQLNLSIGYAVRVDSYGSSIRDFHTYQFAKPGTGRNSRIFHSRREELTHDKIETGLSRRSYKTDALYTVCLWNTENPYVTLEQIQKALRRPVFHQYFGRKSCVVSLPLLGILIQAESVKLAFENTKMIDEDILDIKDEKNILAPLKKQSSTSYHWENCDHHGFVDSIAKITSIRRDIPRSRTKWHFGERHEYSFAILGDENGNI